MYYLMSNEESMQSELKTYHCPFTSLSQSHLSQAARIKSIYVLMVLKYSLELLKDIGGH